MEQLRNAMINNEMTLLFTGILVLTVYNHNFLESTLGNLIVKCPLESHYFLLLIVNGKNSKPNVT